MLNQLTPIFENLQHECVLMQAWKKTANYLRYNSWYADTLNIDIQSLRIPRFINEIQEALKQPGEWISDPIHHVLAPKSQQWTIDNNKWKPQDKDIKNKLRPLAHLSLRDQVVATALLLCLADRVETHWGDTRLSTNDANDRRRVITYGHRLYCETDKESKELRHRWGSTKLYRQYYQDYQKWLKRPEIVTSKLYPDKNSEIAIIQSDLSKFYDRVTPGLLSNKLSQFHFFNEENSFFDFAKRVLSWRWADTNFAKEYGTSHGISDFSSVALPQGLVASGFFANIALADFEDELNRSFDKQIFHEPDILIRDACCYVDDLRIVAEVPKGTPEDIINKAVNTWLQNILDSTTQGLRVQKKKTNTTIKGRDNRFLVPQSRTAQRIQNEVSGTIDIHQGVELIGAIEGFFHTQERYSSDTPSENTLISQLLLGSSDMRDDTALRFAAGRYRRTFKSLRPLLSEDESETLTEESLITDNIKPIEPSPQSIVLTKQQLDERAKLFSTLLIEKWLSNPANVRLLLIALDMYPDKEFLDLILPLLKPLETDAGNNQEQRIVKTYCLSELFRAGATETGYVPDEECLPSEVSIKEYRYRLIKEAKDYLEMQSISKLPWYLLQQIILFLSSQNSFPTNFASRKLVTHDKLLTNYMKLAKYLSNEHIHSLEDRSIICTIAHSSFGHDMNEPIQDRKISKQFLIRVFEISPKIALELWETHKKKASKELERTANQLGLNNKIHKDKITVAELAMRDVNPFINEVTLLRLALFILDKKKTIAKHTITPWHILHNSNSDLNKSPSYSIAPSRTKGIHEKLYQLFEPPDWCETEDEKVIAKTGLLLRFAARGNIDFLSNTTQSKRIPNRYLKPISHWEQEKYASYHGRTSFGPTWIPYSSFVENLFFELLKWPGSGLSLKHKSISQLSESISERLAILERQLGNHSETLFLEQQATFPYIISQKTGNRLLRIAIVQSVIPNHSHFEIDTNDPELLNHKIRLIQRRHLTTILNGLGQMIRVRQTHIKPQNNSPNVIDLVVFPELAVHQNDIDPILVPFIRKNKCIMLFGKTYYRESYLPGNPLLNCCQWLIPNISTCNGFRISSISQGKKNLTVHEEKLTPPPMSFRPAQWIINYEWNKPQLGRPLRLSASVCYDATDIALTSDLRDRCDLFIVCALNKDVGMFDRMSESLHYHMYQGVMIVNNGEFGGSNLYYPYKEHYSRQVFHLHGQPQASIAFVEIDPFKLVSRPNILNNELPNGEWKTPPAGWKGTVK